MADDDDPVTVFKRGLSNLLKNDSLTDLTIVCGAYTHKVHKLILFAHSDHFATIPSLAEGLANTIHLKGIGVDDDDEVGDEVREHSKTFYCSYGSHDPDAIRLMVHYLYHLDYSATSASDPARSSTPEADSKCHDSDLVMHARVFAVAARYEVTGLRKLAADKFTNAVNASPDHEDFAEAARVVYSTTPKYVRTLRNIVVSKMNRHDDALLNIDHVMEVVKDDSELMFDLLCGRGARQDVRTQTKNGWHSKAHLVKMSAVCVWMTLTKTWILTVFPPEPAFKAAKQAAYDATQTL
ncbi:hypothetical protein KC333_g7765 [Hortaea werneckii]|nr:hypothetical protein KC333_g7765 [Hortaea werneckii]KAI7307204.1 hypothetical protein KC326_g7675 [Hortaea werneckii]